MNTFLRFVKKFTIGTWIRVSLLLGVLTFILSLLTLPQPAVATSLIDNSIAFTDNFNNGHISGWQSVNNGTKGTPSWSLSNQKLIESKNVNNGTSTTIVSQSGTYFIGGNAAWKDYDYTVTAQPTLAGEVGVVFRYKDSSNYYRFSINQQANYMRLVKKASSKYTLLSQLPITPASQYEIRIVAIGQNFRVFINNDEVLSIDDSTFSAGKIGMYSWNTTDAVFDDVNVQVGGQDYFTIAVVPDTQYEASKVPAMFKAQMKWLADNRGPQNIVAMLHEGDVVNDQIYSKQWLNASNNLGYLDGKIPFVIAAGNHDLMDYSIDPYAGAIDATWFNQLIRGFDSYTVDGTFTPNDYRNTYSLLTTGGVNFMVLSLEFGAKDDVLAWAGQVVDAYPDRHVILLTHDYLNQKNVLRGATSGDRSLPTKYDPTLNTGKQTWDKFVKLHSNVQFVFNGHVSQKIDSSHPYSVGRLVSQNDAGKSVYQVLTNFQTYNNGNGYFRLFRFYPSTGVVSVKTYSPYTKKYLTSSLNQFTFSNVDLGSWQ